ncbi:MAG: pyridoxal-phosphate dependent enzyme, partial [Acidobacteria bacterium]|nr:pyridoxal-phosphate dependent enzyme [Acidobacteriota bacterium]
VSVIQAAGANPLVRTIRETEGKQLITVHADTMASAIRIGNPASWKKALRVIRETAGTVAEVSETEIAIAKAEIGAEGVGCEPASAVTLAGLKKLVKEGFVKPGETVVLVLTGHVLKDADFTLRFHRGDLFEGNLPASDSKALKPYQRSPLVLEPNVEAVVNLLRSQEL